MPLITPPSPRSSPSASFLASRFALVGAALVDEQLDVAGAATAHRSRCGGLADRGDRGRAGFDRLAHRAARHRIAQADPHRPRPYRPHVAVAPLVARTNLVS